MKPQHPSTQKLPPIHRWVTGPTSPEIQQNLHRIQHAKDVQHIAIMPDVHLAHNICVGTVLATSHLIYPQAVGGDIGCGMAAVAFNTSANLFNNQADAHRILDALPRVVPIRKHTTPQTCDWLHRTNLSAPHLNQLKSRDATLQLGTLGRGNHFLEFQRDTTHNRLWLMVHSGSRAMGQAIYNHHTSNLTDTSQGLPYLNANSPAGRVYLHDAGWARAYAELNRRAMIRATATLLLRHFNITLDPTTYIRCDHNHILLEKHFNQNLLVHRKGAAPARKNQPGIIPGSMGTPSFHTKGRGHPLSLNSSSHGAGRQLSRQAAKRSITKHHLKQQLQNTTHNPRQLNQLREEAPTAYKDIHTVMHAQKQLTRPTRQLHPILSHKG